MSRLFPFEKACLPLDLSLDNCLQIHFETSAEETVLIWKRSQMRPYKSRF